MFERLILVGAAMLVLASGAQSVHAEQLSRAWEFDLQTPGTYKVQVEHRVAAVGPTTKVAYSLLIGEDTRRSEIELNANGPFIPFILDVKEPRKVRVVITGLPQAALEQTRVYVYEESTVQPWKYFDPEASATFDESKLVRDILRQRPETIDLAKTKLTIDKMIDPSVDVNANLKTIDAIVASIKVMPEFGTLSVPRLLALKRYVYEPGKWNDNRAFEYDLDDPLGANIKNKLLSSYLASKKGNCVTMPLLIVILSQRLGIDVTLSTAPKHLFVKFRNDLGTWINLEATSGANPARDVWVRQQNPMTDEAIANGVYMQPLSKKETVAVIATILAEYYFEQGQYEKAIEIADLTLASHPKDVGMMTLKGAAYGQMVRRQFVEKYPSPNQIPAYLKGYFERLSRTSGLWFTKAEALGWREETKEQRDKYLHWIEQARQQKTNN